MAIPPLTRAGLVIGLGLGGFFDGIVLHQILGWHHLICTTASCRPTTVEHLQRQNTQDGFFHLACWLLTLLGVVLLFRAARAGAVRWPGAAFSGAVLAGWGIFNLVEGLIDHQLLGLHHVLPASPHWFVYDMLFLASGVLFVMIGGGLMRRAPAAGCHD